MHLKTFVPSNVHCFVPRNKHLKFLVVKNIRAYNIITQKKMSKEGHPEVQSRANCCTSFDKL